MPRPASATIPASSRRWGYWTVCCLGNVSYWVLVKSTWGALFPALGDGNTVLAVALSSVGVWAFHFMILRGVKEAAFINTVVTVAKIIPILLFLVFVGFGFKADIFAANFYGGPGLEAAGLFTQVRGTMLVTVFVFVGIEGASVYSRYAASARMSALRPCSASSACCACSCW